MLPTLSSHTALFLDFDGTLVTLANRPDAIHVPSGLSALLVELQDLLGGALALVSGRQVQVLDHFLAPARLAVAGVHGLQRRDAHGRRVERQVRVHAKVLQTCRVLAQAHAGLLVEDKHAAVAMHYRQAPALEALCHRALCRTLRDVPDLELLQGKSVLEVKPVGVNKGTAIADFLAEAPFAGRVPVFVGDDATDEHGFAVVQAHDGVAVKVGLGPTCAAFRMDSTREVIAWLEIFRDQLSLSATIKGAPGAQA